MMRALKELLRTEHSPGKCLRTAAADLETRLMEIFLSVDIRLMEDFKILALKCHSNGNSYSYCV